MQKAWSHLFGEPQQCSVTTAHHASAVRTVLDKTPAQHLLWASLIDPLTDLNQMLDPKIFDDLSRRIAEGMPRGVQSLQNDLERNLRASLEAALGHLNLVTRDEFEIQQAVLIRTREKLQALERRVAALEKGVK